MTAYTLPEIKVSLSECDHLGIEKLFELDAPHEALLDLLRQKAALQLQLKPQTLLHPKIVKRSLDCRKGKLPHYVFSLQFELSHTIAIKKDSRLKENLPETDLQIPKKTSVKKGPPVIVGAGPAGLAAAWFLAQAGHHPIILERGPAVEERSRKWFQFLKGQPFDPEANLLFGEGGAGAYSDGKLTCRIKDPRVKAIKEIFVQCGAPYDTLFDAKPHIGSNYLPAIIRKMRQQIETWGGSFRFGTHMSGLVAKKPDAPTKELQAVLTSQGEIATASLILATGHSARDTYRMLMAAGLTCSAKPFQMGVRVEHPQTMINENQFGAFCGHGQLPVAEYQLVANHLGCGVDLFSFCMCPGGEILPATEQEGFLCVNGASRRARNTPFANSGLVITLDPKHFNNDPLKGIEFQEDLERRAFAIAGGNFKAPAQTIPDFLKRKTSATLHDTSYPLPITAIDFNELLPKLLLQAMHEGLPQLNHKIKGYTGANGMMLGPESRSCSPLRIERDAQTLQSISYSGIFPVGEGAGYAGGIMSAAVDGMRAAEKIILESL